jgi:CheY-like chemotaxis protein
MAEPDTPILVLVVEDEALIRVATAMSLEDAGYAVIECENADAAIAVLERRSDVRAVFTDVDMPGSMDGLKLARYVKNRWPPIALLVSSGQVSVQEADLPEGGRFIPKPYRMEQVAETIGALTGRA